jgi:hypothetical protein
MSSLLAGNHSAPAMMQTRFVNGDTQHGVWRMDPQDRRARGGRNQAHANWVRQFLRNNLHVHLVAAMNTLKTFLRTCACGAILVANATIDAYSGDNWTGRSAIHWDTNNGDNRLSSVRHYGRALLAGNVDKCTTFYALKGPTPPGATSLPLTHVHCEIMVVTPAHHVSYFCGELVTQGAGINEQLDLTMFGAPSIITMHALMHQRSWAPAAFPARGLILGMDFDISAALQHFQTSVAAGGLAAWTPFIEVLKLAFYSLHVHGHAAAGVHIDDTRFPEMQAAERNERYVLALAAVATGGPAGGGAAPHPVPPDPDHKAVQRIEPGAVLLTPLLAKMQPRPSLLGDVRFAMLQAVQPPGGEKMGVGAFLTVDDLQKARWIASAKELITPTRPYASRRPPHATSRHATFVKLLAEGGDLLTSDEWMCACVAASAKELITPMTLEVTNPEALEAYARERAFWNDAMDAHDLLCDKRDKFRREIALDRWQRRRSRARLAFE